MNKTVKSKRIGIRILRIFLWFIASLLFLIILIALLIQTPPVQNFARKKVEGYLQGKLHTRVEVGNLYIGFPKTIVLKNIFLGDKKQDTLFAAERLGVDISLLKLLHHQVEVNEITLSNATAKVKRVLPDTAFNFQFIIDAFSSPAPKPKDTTASSWVISLGRIQLDKIRAIYQDVITGNDVAAQLNHFEIRISTFDLDKLRFDIPYTNINGLTASVYQSSPLTVPVVDTVKKKVEQGQTPTINPGEVELEAINLDYKNDPSKMSANVQLGRFDVVMRAIDMLKQNIQIKQVSLANTKADLHLYASAKKYKSVKTSAATDTTKGWTFITDRLELDRNNIRFNNDNQPVLQSGMDYAHLDAQQLTLHASNFMFSTDSISGRITEGSVKEKSGFVLNRLETHFMYTSHGASLRNLVIETPGTSISRSIAVSYPSIAALQKDIGQLKLDVDLQNTRLQVKDILYFVPALATQKALSNTSSSLLLDARITGAVSALNIARLRLRGLSATRIDINGFVNGLPNAKKASGNIHINSFASSRRDIVQLVPAKMLPSNITIPEQFNLHGMISGNQLNARAGLELETSLGNANLEASVRNPSNKQTAAYNAVVNLDNFDAGTLLKKDSLFGKFTANITVRGRGYDMKTADASVHGTMQSGEIKKYIYHDFVFDAGIAQQHAQLSASIADANIHLNIQGNADLSAKYPGVVVNANIDSIKTAALHLTTDEIIFRGKINVNMPVTDPDHPIGTIYLNDAVLVRNADRYVFDSVGVDAGRTDSNYYVSVHSDGINAKIAGKYRLTQLGDVFQQAIQPYFAVGTQVKNKPVDPYDFTVDVLIENRPLVKLLSPNIERLEPITLKSHFATASGWNARAAVPMLIMGSNHINNMQLTANAGDSAIAINVSADEVRSGGLAMYHTLVKSSISHNAIAFAVNAQDRASKDRYRLAGHFREPEKGVYALSLDPGNLMLNYQDWTIREDNSINISKQAITAHNFILEKDGQQLSINSNGTGADAPMDVQFSRFRIVTLTAFVLPDTALADGVIDGKITLTHLTTKMSFTGDLGIASLSMKNDTIGDVRIKVNNADPNTLATDIALTGRGNDLRLTGNYYLVPKNNNGFDLNLRIQTLQLQTITGATSGMLSSASGSVNGQFALNGTIKSPKINGDLNFNKAELVPAMLNNLFRIDQEKISIDEQGIHFDNFDIQDSASNKLTINGLAQTTNFTNYNFDLTIRAQDFRALNSTRKDNHLYYGKLYFNTNLVLKCTEKAPSVNGRLTVNDKTDFTVTLPQKNPGVEERNGIVRFISMGSLPNDTLFMQGYDSLNKSTYTGMDISLNISVNKNAKFNMVVDEDNGDMLSVKGEAALNAGIDPSGKITMTGLYTLNEGSYDLSFNLLHRRFIIQQGSTITWTGEPTKANLNITAVYISNAAPIDLIQEQLDPSTSSTTRTMYRQRLPFEVHLVMEGELLKPDLSFDVVLPTEKNYQLSADVLAPVQTKLTQLRTDPSEMNKQVFALLLLNRFVGENPFQSSAGGTSAGTMALQSVSKILADQLNQLAGSLVQGVDINFDLASTEDYTSGTEQSRTDLNVQVSKRLLNDRLTVTVGSDFQLQGQNANQNTSNLAGNVAIDYKLSKDGRYLLRVYRRNDYQGIIEGYVIEQGIGFIISVDYNKFKEIFQKRKKRKKDLPGASPAADDKKVISSNGS